MAGLTAALIRQALIDSVGETSTGLLFSHVDAIWQRHSDKAVRHPSLQYLYTRRDLIGEVAMPDARLLVQTTTGARQIYAQQRFDHLSAMYEQALAEVARIEAMARGSRAPAVAALSTTAPVAPPYSGLPNAYPADPVSVDANDPDYRGSPYGVSDRRM